MGVGKTITEQKLSIKFGGPTMHKTEPNVYEKVGQPIVNGILIVWLVFAALLAPAGMSESYGKLAILILIASAAATFILCLIVTFIFAHFSMKDELKQIDKRIDAMILKVLSPAQRKIYEQENNKSIIRSLFETATSLIKNKYNKITKIKES
jgi:Cu/Ag efflux pump CusA